MQLIDGKAVAHRLLEELRAEVAAAGDPPPTVAFLRVGEDPASVSYVNGKERTAAQVGIRSLLRIFPETASVSEVMAEIDRLNADPSVHGILVQSPLPGHLPEQEIFERVDPGKDVDGLTSRNLGRLCQEDGRAFAACTPSGILELLRAHDFDPAGRHAVVLGRSLLVGKSCALLLMRKAALGNATVTLCHSRTRDLASLTRQADLLIAAIGKPRFVTADMVKPGAVVIDVGINRVEDPAARRGYRLVGDVDFETVAPLASLITPVPGGVGPMTVAMLMRNTVEAWRRARRPADRAGDEPANIRFA